MNDLISRQAARSTLNDEITITGKSNAIAVTDYVRRVERRLEQLTAVDAVPVVRCEDCIYYDCIYTFKVGNCVYKHRNWPVSNEEFCSKGESKSK